jgi:erythritol kinase
MQSNMAATLNIDWAVDLVREGVGLLDGREVSRREALLALDGRVLDARPGAALYHPYILEAGERGPFVDVNARAQLTGLTTGVRLLDLIRSVYEGLGFAARDCYAAIGHRPEEIRLAGGAARSKALRSILASALGAPVRLSAREEAGAAGCVMMAACAIGLYPDMAAACRTWVDPLLGEAVPPDPGLAALYDRLFPVYAEIHHVMRPVWAGLAAARTGGTP